MAFTGTILLVLYVKVINLIVMYDSERLIKCIVLFNICVVNSEMTTKPAFLFPEKKTFFPLVSGTRQTTEQALRQDNVYIFSIILFVTRRRGYPNRTLKA